MSDLSKFQFQTVSQYAELTPPDVRQLFVPGRGRDEQGNLSPQSIARYTHAAAFCLAHGDIERIVCVGDKTPPDTSREPWTAPDGTLYQGKPEAYGGREILLNAGVSEEIIVVEPDSVDTARNFVLGRKKLLPGLATGIVSQIGQLQRMLEVNAPRTFEVPFTGVVVPELDDNPDQDSLAARLHSQYILRGVTPSMDQARMDALTQMRSDRAWRLFGAAAGAARIVKKLVPFL